MTDLRINGQTDYTSCVGRQYQARHHSSLRGLMLGPLATWLDITFPVLFAYYTKLAKCCARIGKFCLLFIYGHKYLCGSSEWEWATIMIFIHSPRRSIVYYLHRIVAIRSMWRRECASWSSPPFPPHKELSSFKVGVIILIWWWW